MSGKKYNFYLSDSILILVNGNANKKKVINQINLNCQNCKDLKTGFSILWQIKNCIKPGVLIQRKLN